MIPICACSDKGSTYLRDTPETPEDSQDSWYILYPSSTEPHASPPPSYDAAPETRTGGAHPVVHDKNPGTRPAPSQRVPIGGGVD